MKNKILLFVFAIVFAACDNEGSKLIKEHVKKLYFEEPTADFDFEEIRKDSVYTVADSMSLYVKSYKNHNEFISYMSKLGYDMDSLQLDQYVDSCLSRIVIIRRTYSQSIKKNEAKIKELKEYLQKSDRFGMGSFLSALERLPGVNFKGEIRKVEKEVESDKNTIIALGDIESLFHHMKELKARDDNEELCQFWYAQYIVEIARGSHEFEKRFSYRYILSQNDGVWKIFETESIDN